MAVLATTATEDDIRAHLKNVSAMVECTDFVNTDRSFEEKGETFYLFALFAEGHWVDDIEKAITNSGKKFKWL